MAVYRRPFLEPGESRRPTLTWPRQIPIDGEPADVVAIVDAYASWLAAAVDLPKLFVNADPGVILTGPQREFCRTWPNQQEVTVRGSHFIQEDSPDEIGEAVAAFVALTRCRASPCPSRASLPLPSGERGVRAYPRNVRSTLRNSSRRSWCSQWPARSKPMTEAWRNGSRRPSSAGLPDQLSLP